MTNVHIIRNKFMSE